MLKLNKRGESLKLNEDFLEYYVLTLLVLGLPLVAFLYADYRLSLLTFIIVQIIIGVLAIRKK